MLCGRVDWLAGWLRERLGWHVGRDNKHGANAIKGMSAYAYVMIEGIIRKFVIV